MRIAQASLAFASWAVAVALFAVPVTAAERPPAGADAPVFAAGEPAFEAIGASEGLGSHSIFAAMADHDGFVWFAGDNGVHRYDGRELHTIDREPGRPGTLASRTNQALAETRDALWILSFSGLLQRLDRRDGTVRTFVLQRPDKRRAGRGTSLAVDKAGTLWVGTDLGLFRFDPRIGRAEHVPLFGGREPRVTTVIPGNGGTLLRVGTVDGHLVTLWLYEPNVVPLRKLHAPPAIRRVPDGAVPLILLEVNYDSLFIGTNQGLYHLGLAAHQPELRRFGPPELRGVIDSLVFDDVNDSLWLGGAQTLGLLRLDFQTGRLWTFRHHPDDPQSLPADRVAALALDAHANLWIGLERGGAARLRVSQAGIARLRAGDERTDNACAMRPLPDGRVAVVLCADGLVLIDPKTGAVEDRQGQIDAALAFPAPGLIAHTLAPDGADGYWVPTNNLGLVHWRPDHGARRYPLRAADGTELPDPYMNDAVVDATGRVWIACSLGLATLAPGGDHVELLPRDAEPGRSLTGGVLSLALAPDGALWLGTTQGLLHHVPGSDHTARYAYDANDASSLSDDLVISLHVARDGTLWVGTQAGLDRALPQHDGSLKFRRFGTAEGLPDQTIDALVSDARGRLWVGTHRGIAGLDMRGQSRFRAFAPGDGVPDSPVNWRAALAAADGSLYFGTEAGLLHVFPDRLANADPQPIRLGSLEVAGEPRLNLLGSDLPPVLTDYDRGRVRFTIAAFGDHRPLGYRMVGLDPRWRDLPATLSVGYDPLPPGRYVFEVRQMGRDGAWGAPAVTVSVRVLPPPWRTAGAYLAYAFLALLVFGWLARGYARKRTNERRHVRELHHLANFDTLTGLPNRALFSEQLAAAMAGDGAPLALFFIDLDRFKNINDSLGHRFGDQVLVCAAHRLAEALPADAKVARLGGDEFTVVLPGMRHEHEAAAMAKALLDAFAVPLRVEGSDVVVTLSVGISLYPAHTRDPALLLQYADSAMYFAKNSGRNALRVFQPEMVAQVSRRLALETSLRGALDAGELSPVFQPQVALASGRISGAEVLLRWHSAEHGTVAPVEFIPILEDTGMIEPVGLWLVEVVCRQLRAWREAGLALPTVAVNVSVHQLIRGALCDRLAELLGTLALPRHALEIEVTESALMENAQAMGAALGELRELGLGIAIDDFGTGYSSFASLSHLPVSKLKIDKVFIDGLGRSDNAGTLCAAMIAMAHNLRLSVVAEGVETEAQHRELVAMGCDEAQGYWYCKPLPLAEFEAFVRERMAKESVV
jgi:diguanylate cyclase (GGDEF)-like protein